MVVSVIKRLTHSAGGGGISFIPELCYGFTGIFRKINLTGFCRIGKHKRISLRSSSIITRKQRILRNAVAEIYLQCAGCGRGIKSK